MNSKISSYFYIAITIVFTVYGQLILKWRISDFPPLPVKIFDKLKFLITLLLDPAIMSGFIAAFLASLAWMAAMTKFELSYAYPFMSLNFVLVLLVSCLFLAEPLSPQKIFGVLLIVLGTGVAARG